MKGLHGRQIVDGTGDLLHRSHILVDGVHWPGGVLQLKIYTCTKMVPCIVTLHCLIEDTCLLFSRTAFLLDAFYCTLDSIV